MTSSRKDHMVKQIAKDLYLQEEVVEAVLERFIDHSVEEIVNKGEFKVHRLLSISTVAYRGYKAGKGEVPDHNRLKIRLSEGIHRLFKMRESDPNLEVTRDNWRGLLSTLTPVRKQKPDSLGKNSEDVISNPFLDED